MIENPKVSIVLPAKNCGAHLAEAVESVLSQTFANLELILIDDHTTDGSVNSLDKSDTRLKVIENRGAGLIDALNTGLAETTGGFIARMDGDDICHPERLERQLEFLRVNPGTDICATQVEMFSDKGVGEGYALYEQWINGIVTPEDILREIFVESPLPHPSVMVRAETYKKLGGYRDMDWAEDYDLWLRAMEAGIGMGKVPMKLLKWRDGPSRLSKTGERYSRLNFMRARAHFLARTLLKEKRPVIWGAGKTGGLLGRLLVNEGAAISGFIDINERKIGGEKVSRPVYAPEYAAQVNGSPILVAVAARGARDLIRSFLNGLGKVEGADYYCVV